MPRSFLILFAASLLAVVAIAPTATAFESYRVTGVPADDTLTMREQPSEGGKPADWKELGQIPRDAEHVLGTGRSVQVNGQRWAEVSFGGTLGWVNAAFLTATNDVPDFERQTFRCAGTEPFWSATLGSGESAYSNPEQSLPLTTERVQPATGRLFPLLYRLKDKKGRSYHATVAHRPGCSDGMSDYHYAFEVLFSGAETFEQGCCVIER